MGVPGGDLLSRRGSPLSSARARFTVLFGMGRGGSRLLWPPDGNLVRDDVPEGEGVGGVEGWTDGELTRLDCSLSSVP